MTVINIYVLFLLQILALNYFIVGKEYFIEYIMKSYVFTYNVEDLQPNIGVFWYYFTEVFSDFRALFIFALQYNPILYMIPVSIRFK